MSNINDFKAFCNTTTGTNLLTQAEYLADPQKDIGNQPGIARSKLVNKATRQATAITYAIAQFISDKLAEDVLDDGDLAALLVQVQTAFAIPSTTAPTVQKFLSGSGTYTLPANVKYIRVKMVAGGGTGGTGTTSGGGGAGGYQEFVINTPAATYSYGVGAAGASTTFGANTCTAGSNGGNGGGGAGGAGGTASVVSLGTSVDACTGGTGGTGDAGGGGNGGNSYFGGGAGVSGGAGGVAAASNTGSGGSANSGAGAAGKVIVEEFY